MYTYIRMHTETQPFVYMCIYIYMHVCLCQWVSVYECRIVCLMQTYAKHVCTQTGLCIRGGASIRPPATATAVAFEIPSDSDAISFDRLWSEGKDLPMYQNLELRRFFMTPLKLQPCLDVNHPVHCHPDAHIYVALAASWTSRFQSRGSGSHQRTFNNPRQRVPCMRSFFQGVVLSCPTLQSTPQTGRHHPSVDRVRVPDHNDDDEMMMIPFAVDPHMSGASKIHEVHLPSLDVIFYMCQPAEATPNT